MASLWALALMLSRLEGHAAAIGPDGLEIADIAGEGRPLIGVVERRGDELWLVPPGIRILGPLAHPRLLGPGYRVWLIGSWDTVGVTGLRFGVLAAP
jgi:hypothetical protein